MEGSKALEKPQAQAADPSDSQAQKPEQARVVFLSIPHIVLLGSAHMDCKP